MSISLIGEFRLSQTDRDAIIDELDARARQREAERLAAQQPTGWLTIAETCELLICGRKKLRSLERNGVLVPVREAGLIRYRRADVETFGRTVTA